MEQKLVRVPFDIELAKKIINNDEQTAHLLGTTDKWEE